MIPQNKIPAMLQSFLNEKEVIDIIENCRLKSDEKHFSIGETISIDINQYHMDRIQITISSNVKNGISQYKKEMKFNP